MTTSIGSPLSSPPEWTLITTLSPSAVTNIDSGALAAYTAYKIVGHVTLSATDTLRFQLNGDATASWRSCGWVGSGTTPTFAGAAAVAGGNIATLTATGKVIFETLLEGVVPANGIISAAHLVSYTNLTSTQFFGSEFPSLAATTQITSIKFLTAGGVVTFTGKILIYGRNDL